MVEVDPTTKSRETAGKSILPSLAVAVFALLWTVGLTLAPQAGSPVAAIFPPWVGANAALAATLSADRGYLRGFGAWPWIVIAQSDAPDFADRLRREGAWLVLRASPLTGCSKGK